MFSASMHERVFRDPKGMIPPFADKDKF
jgi:hypothetical protein